MTRRRNHILTAVFAGIVAVFAIGIAISHYAYRRNLAALLDLQAQNQADTIFRSDSLQQRLVSFFDRYAFYPDALLHPSRTANERLLAHYLLGRAHADMGDAPAAIHDYLEATDCADTTAADCDYSVLCGVYGQMSLVYHYQNLPTDELLALQMSERCNMALGDTLSALCDFARRMGVFFLQEEPDSIISVFRKAKTMFDAFGRSETLSFFYTYPISVYIDQGKFLEASKLLDEAQQNQTMFRAPDEASQGYELYYYYLGCICEHEEKLDSAITFYRKALKYGYEEAAYRGLLSVSARLSQTDSIAHFARLYTAANDRLHRRQRTQVVEQTAKLYNYTIASQLAQRLELTSATYKTTTLLLASSLMLLYVFWQRYRHRVELEQRALREEKMNAGHDYAELMRRYRAANYDMALFQERSEHTQRDLRLTIHDLEDTISQMRESAAVDNKLKALFDSDIYKRLAELVLPHKDMQPASEEDFEELAELIKRVAPNYYRVMTSVKLQPQEFRLCLCLTLLFSPSETAILLGVRGNRITNLKAEANKRLFQDDGAKGLERNLMKNLI